VLPKGDFVINGGKTTVEILNRIAPDDAAFGKDYSERTKKMSAFFKTHYKKMRQELEGPDYFKKMIINSFDYKESEVIKAVKKDFDKHLELYYKLNKDVAPKAKILHLANDYGQLDVLLSLQESQRKIVSYISDEEKRAVAKMNYIVKKRAIHYLENIEEIGVNKYEVVLISDINCEKTIEEIVALADSIILLGTSNFKSTILNFGFTVETEDDERIILKK